MTQLILWNSFDEDHTAVRPIGPHRLAQWLRQHGYTVKVLDFCSLMTTDQLVELTVKHITKETVAIGVSSTFWKPSASIGGLIKRWSAQDQYFEPEWVISARQALSGKFSGYWILGGPGHVLANNRGLKNYFSWEIFYDYSEDNLLKFFDEKCPAHSHRSQFDICQAQPVFESNDHIQSWEFLPLEGSRGCKFSCKFCRFRLIGRSGDDYVRHKQNLLAELSYNYEQWGTTRYFIVDDTYNESNQKIQHLIDCRRILNIDLKFICYSRPDLLATSPGQIEMMEQAGLVSTFFGIESFHPGAAKIIGKGWNGRHGREFLENLQDRWHKKNINFFLSFIIGLGNETVDDVLASHQWCKDQGIAAWNFLPLMISRSQKMIFTSEFDRNYSDYGYRFLHPIHDWSWTNDTWTFEQARDLAHQLNTDPDKNTKLACWEIGHAVNSQYPRSLTELIDMPVKDFDMNIAKQNVKQFVYDYYQKTLSWPN